MLKDTYFIGDDEATLFEIAATKDFKLQITVNELVYSNLTIEEKSRLNELSDEIFKILNDGAAR